MPEIDDVVAEIRSVSLTTSRVESSSESGLGNAAMSLASCGRVGANTADLLAEDRLGASGLGASISPLNPPPRHSGRRPSSQYARRSVDLNCVPPRRRHSNRPL